MMDLNERGRRAPRCRTAYLSTGNATGTYSQGVAALRLAHPVRTGTQRRRHTRSPCGARTASGLDGLHYWIWPVASAHASTSGQLHTIA
jgi:hypothetical protein